MERPNLNNDRYSNKSKAFFKTKYSDDLENYIDYLENNLSEPQKDQETTKENLTISDVSGRSFTKRVSSNGVFFRCDNCGFEPQMESETDDLLIMHYCPKCGSQFE